MNNTKIEYCDMTFNPITGCLCNCPYCYARGIAKRFEGHTCPTIDYYDSYNDEPLYWVINKLYKKAKSGKMIADTFPFGFSPTFHEYRLGEPAKVKKPQTIFVGSMTDLFHDAIPDEWIKAVFEACKAAPQHRYLFLSKNPSRYEQYDRHMPNNMWFGWTQTKPREVMQFTTHHSWNVFVSIEPIQEEFKVFHSNVEWVIIGAETGNRKGKVTPKREWIENIAAQCRAANVPLFMKNSLRGIMGDAFVQETPW